jgi:DivIVA domain-containing protein
MHEEHEGHRHPPASLAEATSITRHAPYLGGEADLLTPADIRNKVFTTVRLREGYDLAQVDTFLDQVETTLISVLLENTALTARLDIPGPAADGGASHIVALAQEAADRAIAMAEEEARGIVTDARDHAATTKREVLTYAARMRESLENQIQQLRDLLLELQRQDGAHH